MMLKLILTLLVHIIVFNLLMLFLVFGLWCVDPFAARVKLYWDWVLSATSEPMTGADIYKYIQSQMKKIKPSKLGCVKNMVWFTADDYQQAAATL